MTLERNLTLHFDRKSRLWLFSLIDVMILHPQISTIKDELDRVKLLIRAHEREGKDQVELHLQELRVTRDELESLKRENAQFIQENNVLDIVRGRKERLEQIEAVSMSYDAGNFNIPATEILTGM